MPKRKQGEWRDCALVNDPSLGLELKRVLEVPLISSNGPGGDHVCELHMGGGGDGGSMRDDVGGVGAGEGGSEEGCEGGSVDVRCDETIPVQGGGSLQRS